MESLTKQKCLWWGILALIWSSKHSYLNLIFCPPKKAVSQSECEIEGRILSAEVRSVWEMISGFSHLSSLPLFIQTFHRPICTHWSLNMLLTRGEGGRRETLGHSQGVMQEVTFRLYHMRCLAPACLSVPQVSWTESVLKDNGSAYIHVRLLGSCWGEEK